MFNNGRDGLLAKQRGGYRFSIFFRGCNQRKSVHLSYNGTKITVFRNFSKLPSKKNPETIEGGTRQVGIPMLFVASHCIFEAVGSSIPG
jgi:hypothetical protein